MTAYVYCGNGVSQCDLYGGWEINVNAINFDNGFELNCEIRLGSGVCKGDWKIDVTDILIGAFRMSPNLIESTLFDVDLGAQDFTLEMFDNNTRRRDQSLTEVAGSAASLTSLLVPGVVTSQPCSSQGHRGRRTRSAEKDSKI